MPFAWTVNPYRGCAMGCRYCYAAYTHEFMGIAGADFHSLVYVKTGGDDETARRLAAVVRSGETIALGTATDPYQPAEADSKVTRRFLEMVARHRNVRIGLITKGALREGVRDARLPRRSVPQGHRRPRPAPEAQARVRGEVGRCRLAPPGAGQTVLSQSAAAGE